MTDLPLSRRYIMDNAQRTFHLWGPNSGGGEDLCVCDNRVFLVAYGDAARSPDNAGYEVRELTLEALEQLAAHNAPYADAAAYVRACGARG